MDINRFIRELLYKEIGITNYPINFSSWDTKAALKHLTKFVRYSCGKPPKCIGNFTNVNTLRCCCGYCAHNIGYLQEVPARLDVLYIYSSLYKKDVGFWSTKGCVLPRPLRSTTCLTYHCNHSSMPAIDQIVLDIILYGINDKDVKRRVRKFVTPVSIYAFMDTYLKMRSKEPLDYYGFFGDLIKRTIKQLGSNYNTIYEGVPKV